MAQFSFHVLPPRPRSSIRKAFLCERSKRSSAKNRHPDRACARISSCFNGRNSRGEGDRGVKRARGTGVRKRDGRGEKFTLAATLAREAHLAGELQLQLQPPVTDRGWKGEGKTSAPEGRCGASRVPLARTRRGRGEETGLDAEISVTHLLANDFQTPSS